MAEEFKKVDLVEAEGAPKTDFVQLVKDAVQGHGMSTFLRVNLDEHVTAEGLEKLNEEYASQGYEVFTRDKSVLLLRN